MLYNLIAVQNKIKLVNSYINFGIIMKLSNIIVITLNLIY